MAWSKGQGWRVVGGLQTLNTQLQRLYPRARPPATPLTSWGSIADDEHDSTSDHYPHYYAALGSMAVVCARDFPHAASLGMDGGLITEALRRSRDPRIGYVIFAGRIFSGNGGSAPWQWRKYTGRDGHYEHFHVSSVHTAAADDTRPWTLPGVTASTTGDDVNLSDPNPFGTKPRPFTEADKDAPLWLGDGPNGNLGAMLQYMREDAYYARLFARETRTEVRELTERLDNAAAPATGGPVGALSDADVERIAARVDALLAARLAS